MLSSEGALSQLASEHSKTSNIPSFLPSSSSFSAPTNLCCRNRIPRSSVVDNPSSTKNIPIEEYLEMNRQVEFHYINTGFPYTITESFMNLFEGLTYGQTDFSFPGPMPDQEFAYWSMHAGSNKFGSSIPGSAYYGYGHPYGENDHLPRLDEGRRAWENSSMTTHEEPEPLVMHAGESFSTNPQSSPEECVRGHHEATSSQVIWQDNIDPDNMTYEELLDLGEAVGTHCRGLSQELISSLPVSKYKRGRFFLRKKSCGERCVICQMEYKKGERQITLPCKHVYHANCGSRWLSINKACPVCYTEVFGEDSKHSHTNR